MSVDEIIEAATNGDADAALAIAQIMIEGEKPDYDGALPWFEMAAKNGSVQAALFVGAIRKGKMKYAKANSQWENLIAQVNPIADHCECVIDSKVASKEQIDLASEIFDEVCYLYAFALYMSGDLNGAMHRLRRVKTVHTPIMHILMGCLMFDLSLKEKAITYDVLNDILNLFSALERNPKELLSATEDYADNLILSKAFGYMSIILKSSPYNNLERAYNILKIGFDLLPEGVCRNAIREEMQHYRQKLFGGMQYI